MEDALWRAVASDLECDGVVGRLFEILWRRDQLNESSLALRIPDTIIFKYNAPSVWYFTSVDGTIKRKTKAKLTCEHIEQEFLRKPSPSGIVACFVATLPAGPESARDASNSAENEAPSRTTLEYLDAESLHDFLHNRRRVRGDGILQRFVEPKGDNNHLLRAMWSPKVCLLERRVNRLRLTDTRYDVYERAVTFEGPDYHSEVTAVRGGAVMSKVLEVANAIVDHLGAVTGERIRVSRMALNLKVDAKDRLHLLFCSSLRLQDDMAQGAQIGGAMRFARQCLLNTPLEAGTKLAIPDHVRKATSGGGRPVALQRHWCCPTCEAKVESGSLLDISYKVLIEHDEQNAGCRRVLPAASRPPWPTTSGSRRSLEGEAERACDLDLKLSGSTPDLHTDFVQNGVPETIQLLHPRLKPEEYASLRHDILFLHKAVAVCDGCYLKFSAPQLGPEHAANCAELGPVAFTGTQALDPSRIRKRQKKTFTKLRDKLDAEEAADAEQARRRQRDAEERLGRAASCPKLPLWGAGQNGVPLWQQPVLTQKRPPMPAPMPPSGPAPPSNALASAVRSSSQANLGHDDLVPKQARLRSNPYLKELQSFAVQCRPRAEYVLPSAFSDMLGSVQKEKQSKKERREAKAAKAAARAAAEDVAGAEAEEAEQANDDLGEIIAREESDYLEDLDDEEEDGVVERLGVSLWKWAPGADGVGLITPTTATPSGSTRPSSSGTRSNSTRPSSRLQSARSRSTTANERLGRPHRLSRPTSSPQLLGIGRGGGSRGAFDTVSGLGRGLAEEEDLFGSPAVCRRGALDLRPRSSPQYKSPGELHRGSVAPTVLA
eukprot:TRINITY_DN29903_c0_g3_i1.p1 TRINITY_DN29903_c0_g3~~TRINITY_DN29903_c0_g3_i1.p1  ORF type:complete len:831 (-),score=184.80 TRINITY_DN29903_c0_g3_i1:204-2696(-)